MSVNIVLMFNKIDKVSNKVDEMSSNLVLMFNKIDKMSVNIVLMFNKVDGNFGGGKFIS